MYIVFSNVASSWDKVGYKSIKHNVPALVDNRTYDFAEVQDKVYFLIYNVVFHSIKLSNLKDKKAATFDTSLRLVSVFLQGFDSSHKLKLFG